MWAQVQDKLNSSQGIVPPPPPPHHKLPNRFSLCTGEKLLLLLHLCPKYKVMNRVTLNYSEIVLVKKEQKILTPINGIIVAIFNSLHMYSEHNKYYVAFSISHYLSFSNKKQSKLIYIVRRETQLF